MTMYLLSHLSDCKVLSEDKRSINLLYLIGFNSSDPVQIYSYLSQNAQSFDPSGSTWFYMQNKEEVDLSYEKYKIK